MSTYRKEWPCCGDVSETQSYEPESCPFCAPALSRRHAAEQPTAAGNALTDGRILELANQMAVVSTNYFKFGDARMIAFARAIEQHLRAAPQAAQGEGLTDEEYDRLHALAMRLSGLDTTKFLRNFANTIAAHTRASDGKDSERLDWLAAECAVVHEHGTRYRLCWTEHDEYQSEFYPSPRAAIDAAMQQAASNQQEGA